MLIAKFALVSLLCWLLLLQTLQSARPAPVGGPYYFADPPDATQAFLPRYRLSYLQARRSKRTCKVWFDNRSRPVEALHMEGQQLRWRMDWVWTKSGRLRLRVWSRDGQVFRVDEPPEPAPTR